MKKEWTDEERQAFADKMKAAREKSKLPQEAIEEAENVVDIQTDESTEDLKRQIAEMQKNMAQMQAMMMQPQMPQMNRSGDLIGEWEKYLVDPANYPDPTPRLAKETKLAPLAFELNYELEYKVGVTSYQTKTGKNVKEPKFEVQLNRIVLDNQGNKTPKRYIARKMVFHEDPDAALAIAKENGLEVDKSDERTFLNEMRYYRVRDWLFGIFYPKPTDEQLNPIKEEVIAGQVVQVFTKSSENPSEIEFNKLDSKLR
jgi:hypothetical protein